MRLLFLAIALVGVLTSCSAPSPREITFVGSSSDRFLTSVNGLHVLSMKANARRCEDGAPFLDEDKILMGHCGMSDQDVQTALSEVALSGWRIRPATPEHFAARRAALDREISDRETQALHERGFQTFELGPRNRFSFDESEIALAFRTACDQAPPEVGRCAPMDEYRWHITIERGATGVLFVRRYVALEAGVIEAFDCRRVQAWECALGQHGPVLSSSTLPQD